MHGIGKATHVAKRNAEILYKQTHTIHNGFVRVQGCWNVLSVLSVLSVYYRPYDLSRLKAAL